MSSVRVVKGKTITLGSNVTGVNDYSLEVVADLLQASGNTKCTITSAVRDSFNQARVMYDAIKADGVTYWKSQYRDPGQAVIDVYVKETKSGNIKSSVIAAMKAKIDDFLKKGIRVSRHMGDPNELQVFDISKSSITNKSAFIKAVGQSKSYRTKGDKDKGRISHYIPEKRAYHIEIPQDGKTTTGESTTDIPSQAPPAAENEIAIVKYVHPNSSGVGNLIELVKDPSFIGYDIPAQEVFDFEYLGKTNNERMWEALDLGNKKLFGKNDTGDYNENELYPVVPGMTLYIPVDKITLGTRLAQANNGDQLTVVETRRKEAGEEAETEIGSPNGSSNIPTYTSNITIQKTKKATLYPQVLRRLSLDPGYVPAYNNRGIVAQDIYPQLSIKFYSKVLAKQRDGDGFITVTADVIRCDIESRMEGGSFNIELQPKIGYLDGTEKDNESGWATLGDIETKNGESLSMYNINKERVFKSTRSPSGQLGSERRRSQSFFNMVLQQNDMVWIKFERLGFEQESSLKKHSFNEWYDLIGLIDAITTTSNAANTDLKINIRGRDLSKALHDDNSYFNPYSIGHASAVYGDTPFANGRYGGGGFKELSAIQARSIQDAIEFIFHRVASIGYVPDDVFSNLLDKTEITKTTITPDGKEQQKIVKGVWQCMKLFIDDSIRGLRLIDDSISNPDGSIWQILKKICQDPFVEFFSDTYGDKYYLIARRPPFEAKTVREIVRQVGTIDSRDGEIKGSARQDSNAYKRYLDRQEENRSKDRPEKDQTLSEAKADYIKLTGARGENQLNNMTEVEQQQFLLGSTELDEINVAEQQFPLIINLSESDVLSDSLEFSNEAYSWFQVTDRGNFAGASITLGYVPALYFDEMAQLFGNRRLEVVSNYSNYKFFQSNRTKDEADLYAEQAAQHLAYLVETNIHLPFTRRGSITLNGGDRRIKKGNYIYYRPTQEIFYVTGVSHGISINATQIDRSTKVDVERGMLLPYIKGQVESILQEDGSTKDVRVSYFDIVNIPKLQDGVRDAVTNGTANDKFDYKANISINKDILNFFLERRQFKQYD